MSMSTDTKSATISDSRRVLVCASALGGHTGFSPAADWMRCFVQGLLAAGDHVTVLLPPDSAGKSGNDPWTHPHLEVEVLSPALETEYQGSLSLRDSWWRKKWLESRRFDITFFEISRCTGYLPMLAHRQGNLPGTGTTIGIAMEPAKWSAMLQGQPFDTVEQMTSDFAERETVSRLDALLSTSPELTAWMENEGWDLPAQVTTLPALPWHEVRPVPAPALHRDGPIDLAVVMDDGVWTSLEWLGAVLQRFEPGEIGTIHVISRGYSIGLQHFSRIQEHCSWGWEKIQQQTVKSLELCLPGLLEKSLPVLFPGDHHPMAGMVRAVLEAGIPVALNPNCPAASFFEKLTPVEDRYRAEVMAAQLRAIAAGESNGWSVSSGAADEWDEWLHSLPALIKRPARPSVISETPMVSVLLCHYNRRDYLLQALESLHAQTWTHFEVILVDDGSTDPGALAYLEECEADFSKRGWKVRRQKNQGPAAARNLAAAHAQGEVFLIMDDDNVALPQELEILVRAMQHSGAELLNPLIFAFDSREQPDSCAAPSWMWIPVGPCSELGVTLNCYGDTNMLVTRDAYARAGGFDSDEGGITLAEDWRFLAKADIAGVKAELFPDQAFWYRRLSDSNRRSAIGTAHSKSMGGPVPFKPLADPKLHRFIVPAAAALRHNGPRYLNHYMAYHESRTQQIEKDCRKLKERQDALIAAIEAEFNSRRWRMANLFRWLRLRIRNAWDKNALMPGSIASKLAACEKAQARLAERIERFRVAK